MSIGLYDYDMKWYVPCPFNLEIMKLANYYKQHNQLVSLAPDFLPDNYTKFIIRKDYIDNRAIDDIASYDNIEYGGYYFTNGLYIPLPEEIELTKPSPSIYNRWKKQFTSTWRGSMKWTTSMLANHLRLSLNNRNVWEKFLEQTDYSHFYRSTFIHDFNVTAIKDSYEAIREILNEYKRHGYVATNYMNFKFPIQVYTMEELKKWYNCCDRFGMVNFQYNGFLSNAELYEIYANYNLNCRMFYYNVCLPDNLPKEKFLEVMSQIFYQVVFLRQHNTYFSLIMGTNFPQAQEWDNVLDLWNKWLYQGTQHVDIQKRLNEFGSLYSFCKKNASRTKERYVHLPNVNKAREAFNFVGQEHPQLFNDFYTLNDVEIGEGGEILWQKRISHKGLKSS